MKVRIISLLAVLLLLFVMGGGCSPAGSTSLNTVLKLLPGDVDNLFVADWNNIRSDSNMEELWAQYSTDMDMESMEEYLGINADDIELMAMAQSGTSYYIILKGTLDLEKIRAVLEENGSMERQDDYLRTELWSGDGSVAFIRDMMVVAMSVDSLKTVIRLHEGQEKDSFYNDDEFNPIIEKLPAGFFTLFTSQGEYEATATGMSFSGSSAEELSFSQYYLFDDTAAAEAGKTDIEDDISGYFEGTVDSVNQKNSLVEIKGTIGIEDFMYSDYFNNMGF